MAGNKAELEALLRRRGWGPTLERRAAEGAAAWDELRGGTITEIVPARREAAGVTSLGLHLTARHGGGAWRAWIDPQDRLDPDSAERVGLRLESVLWLRGGGSAEKSMEAAQQIVQAGRFRVVVMDFLEQENAARLARAAWFRLLRAVERQGQTSVVVMAAQALTGTCADRVLAVSYEGVAWAGDGYPQLAGARLRVETVNARRGPGSEQRVVRRSQEFVA
jgi:cell division inhibitor SulA